MSEIIYQSDTLLVRYVAGSSDEAGLIITFDSYHDDPGVHRPGFAETLLRQNGVSALHFLTANNDWFQSTDIVEAINIAARFASRWSRVVVTGSSMGGYAALRFAKALCADSCIVFSPQYSAEQAKIPFETRWKEVRSRIKFLKHANGRIEGIDDVILIYDPSLNLDQRHIDMISKEIKCRILKIPFGDHAISGFLQEINLLHRIINPRGITEEIFAELSREIRIRRKDSMVWLGNLALSQPHVRSKMAVSIARFAYHKWPNHPLIIDRLAITLRNNGNYEESCRFHLMAIFLANNSAPYLWNYSKTLHLSKKFVEALEVTRQLQQKLPAMAGYHWQAARLEAQLGMPLRAFRSIWKALRIAPRNIGYWMLFIGLLGIATRRSIKKPPKAN